MVSYDWYQIDLILESDALPQGHDIHNISQLLVLDR